MALLLLVDWCACGAFRPCTCSAPLLVLLLGGATLMLRDTRFLKWKPTVFLWLVARRAVGSAWFGHAPLAQRLLQPLIARSEALPRRTWLALNWLWVAFYVLLGAAQSAGRRLSPASATG